MSSGQDLMRRIASAGARMDPGLSGRDVERLVAGARQLRQHRRARRVAFAAGAACSLALLLVAMAHRGPRSSHPELTAEPKPDLVAQPQARSPLANSVVRLADGSTAFALDPATQIAVAEDKNDRVELVLTRGRGRFDVKPRPSRTFAVHVGRVTVTALGTVFTVERVADRVGVAVESGTVRVDWGVGSALLEENNSGWYPPLVISGLGDRTTSQESARSPSSSPPLALPRQSSASPIAGKTESAADLLLAADKARISGHAEQAAELLRKLLREHRNDARAPLAAFTLGRMLLMELARPLEAAAVFAEARRLSPGGPFAEDALAREVEAFSKAGVPMQAHARAEEYLRLYPKGRRAAIVGAMGGIK
jgi:transmembrane sensor